MTPSKSTPISWETVYPHCIQKTFNMHDIYSTWCQSLNKNQGIACNRKKKRLVPKQHQENTGICLVLHTFINFSSAGIDPEYHIYI